MLNETQWCPWAAKIELLVGLFLLFNNQLTIVRSVLMTIYSLVSFKCGVWKSGPRKNGGTDQGCGHCTIARGSFILVWHGRGKLMKNLSTLKLKCVYLKSLIL